MLRQMRENFKSLSWTLWLVIIVFVIGFVVFSGPLGHDQEQAGTELLKVGQVSIPADQYRKTLLRTLEQYRNQMKGNLNKSLLAQLQVPEQILQDYVNRAIIRQEAVHMGIEISDREVAKTITELPVFQHNGSFVGAEAYRSFLARNRMTVGEFEDSIRDSIRQERLLAALAAGIVIDDDELRTLFRQEKDQADIRLIRFGIEDIKVSSEPSDSEIATFHKDHAHQFMTEEKRSGQVVHISNSRFAKEVNLTDDDLFAYYKGNKSLFLKQAQTSVSRIFLPYTAENRDAVQKEMETLSEGLTPENFAAMAQKHSQDNKAAQGGDWGQFAWKSLTSQEQQLIEQKPQNAITNPVDTGNGFAVLWMRSKTPEIQETFDQVRDRISATLKREKTQALASAEIGRLKKTLGQATTFAADAKKQGAEVTPITNASNGDPLEGVDALGTLSRTLFSLNAGEISDPVELVDGQALVLLEKVAPPEPQPLETCRAQVAEAIRKQQALELAQKRALALREQLLAQKDAAQWAAILSSGKIEAEKTTYRRGNRLSGQEPRAGLDDLIFSAPSQTVLEPLTYPAEVLLTLVDKVQTSTDQDFATEKARYRASKLLEKQQQAFGTYLASRRQDYPIQFNSKLFNEIKENVLDLAR